MVTTEQLIAERKIGFEAYGSMTIDPRRVSMKRRLAIDRGEWKDLAVEHIKSVHETPEIATRICGFFDPSLNIQSRVVDRLAVAYKHPPARMVGTAPGVNKKWGKVMREAKINRMAKAWGRYAYLCGCVYVVPFVRETMDGTDRRLVAGFETILPDRIVDVFFGDDPCTPDVLVYEHREKDGSSDDMNSRAPRYVALDALGWTYFDIRWNQVEFRPHGVNRRIHVKFQVSEGQPGDHWDWRRNLDLESATLNAQRVWCTMGYIRKGQNRKRQVLQGADLSDVPAQQVDMSEQALLLQGVGIDFKIHDFSQAIDHFKDEIRTRIEMVAEARGIPSSMVDLENGPQNSANIAPIASSANAKLLSEKRDDQVEYLRESEAELAYRLALVLDAAGHPDRVNPEQVRSEFKIDFPPLTFTEEPQTRLAVGVEKIKAGLSDHVVLYREYHPEFSWMECADHVLGPGHGLTEADGHVAVRNYVNEQLSKHQIPVDPMESGEQLSARQGRIGGQATPPDDSESDE